MTDHDDALPLAGIADEPDELDEALEVGTMSEVERLLNTVIDEIAAARTMPMSSSVMINRDDVLDLLLNLREQLPEDLRQARWMIKERQDFLDRTNAEAEEILDSARARAEQMVQRTEIVKASEQRARKIVDAAESEARVLRMECEDFCDQRLAQFEIVLERTMKMVTAGRAKLATPIVHTATAQLETVEEAPDNAFFDQDQN